MTNPISPFGFFRATSTAQLGSLIASGTLSPIKLALVQGALHSPLKKDRALREAFSALHRFEGDTRAREYLQKLVKTRWPALVPSLPSSLFHKELLRSPLQVSDTWGRVPPLGVRHLNHQRGIKMILRFLCIYL